MSLYNEGICVACGSRCPNCKQIIEAECLLDQEMSHYLSSGIVHYQSACTTVIALDNKVCIKASPSVLGVNGEKSKEWITLGYSSSLPCIDGCIGVFSPANFRSTFRAILYGSST